MKKKYFFKNQSSLQRQIIAGSLAAVFVAGTVGSSFAGAMDAVKQPNGEVIILENDNNNQNTFQNI